MLALGKPFYFDYFVLRTDNLLHNALEDIKKGFRSLAFSDEKASTWYLIENQKLRGLLHFFKCSLRIQKNIGVFELFDHCLTLITEMNWNFIGLGSGCNSQKSLLY